MQLMFYLPCKNIYKLFDHEDHRGKFLNYLKIKMDLKYLYLRLIKVLKEVGIIILLKLKNFSYFRKSKIYLKI